MHRWTISPQALEAASIPFVGVVRDDDIIQEFHQYGLPDWLRDLVDQSPAVESVEFMPGFPDMTPG